MDGLILLPALQCNFAAYNITNSSLKLSQLNLRGASGGKVPGHWEGTSSAFDIGFSLTLPTWNYHHPSSYSFKPVNSLSIDIYELGDP